VTTTASALRYERSPRVLWRDTGRRVVCLPAGRQHEVSVLGGASAELWRRLAAPSTLAELAETFVDETGGRPAVADIRSAVEPLLARDLVRVQSRE
jgi:hypothetical protein